MSDDASARIGKGGDLDLAAVDLAKRPARKARNRPDPPAELHEWAVKAERRMFARPYPPNITLEPAGFDKEDWTSPHSDPALWTLQLADAFGTRSHAVLSLFMSQLESLCGRGIWDDDARQWRLNESELSATLALVNAFRPKNEPEAMLAAQMVATHLLTMKVGARALRYDHDTRTAAVYAKLAKAFAVQTGAMQDLKGKRRGTRQTIVVKKELHQSVHYHDHRGDSEKRGRPHERNGGTAAEIADQRPAVRREDAGGVVVPLARPKGSESL